MSDEEKFNKALKPDLMERFFAIAMAMALITGGFLYWQGYIKEPGIILLGIFGWLYSGQRRFSQRKEVSLDSVFFS